MILVFIGISIVTIFIGACVDCSSCHPDGEVIYVVGVTGFILSFIAFLIFLYCFIGGATIPEKIRMYEAENTQIEQNIAEIVQNYQTYEKDTYADLKPDGGSDVIASVSMYPELKSDSLVAKQIEIHTENQNIIKELKIEEINMRSIRWWLYFGKLKQGEVSQ